MIPHNKLLCFYEGAVDKLKDTIKKFTFIASLLGIYYLFVFTYRERIPFPLDLTILPTMLVAVGLICILITTLMVVYSTMAIIVVSDPLEINYREIISANSFAKKYKFASTIINYVMFFCFTPLTMIVLYGCKYDYADFLTLTSMFMMPLLCAYYAVSPTIKLKDDIKLKFKNLFSTRYIKTALTIFYISALLLLSIYVFLKYIEFGFSSGNKPNDLLALFFYFTINLVIILPPKKSNSFQKLAETYSPLNWKKQFLRTPAFYAYCLIFTLTLIPDVAYNTAAQSLKFLNIGGGIDRSYYFEKSKAVVPSDLIEKCDKNNICLTKNIHVIFDLGSVVYIKGPYITTDDSLISLQKTNLFLFTRTNKNITKN